MPSCVPDDGVEVAVAVEVGEAGRAEGPHIDAVERIGGAGALGEGRRDGRAGVLEIAQGAVVFPDEGVEVAVAVEVGEARRAEVPHIDAVERIGGAGLLGEIRRGLMRRGVREIVQVAVVFPDDGVEVAVAVEVGEARCAEVPHIDAVERIGGAGALGEGRRDGRAGVLEIVQGAVAFPDDGVEVAVAVEVGEARRAGEPHIDAVERIGGAGALGEGRRGGRAGVLEIVQGAVEFPDDGVEVAVAVEVGEARRAVVPHIEAVERIGGAGALGEGRRNGRAGVLEIVQGAVDVPDDGVEVAVAVEVGEAGRAADTDIDAVERIGGAGALGEDRRGGRAGVLEIVQGAVVLPDDGVEVAVAVEVGEAGRAVVPHIDAVERIGGAGLLPRTRSARWRRSRRRR